MNHNAPSDVCGGGIRLFVGLGNPGTQYEGTRHNAGFAYVDALAESLGLAFTFDKNYKGLLARTQIEGKHVYLLKPLTFMNESGQSVAPLARFFKIEPQEILVAHDELDIVSGCIKLKCGGGHAGHNGLRSIQAQMGSADFWRLRLGIGHPGDKSQVAGYVLRKPPLEDRLLLDNALDCSLGVTPFFLLGKFADAQRVLHGYRP